MGKNALSRKQGCYLKIIWIFVLIQDELKAALKTRKDRLKQYGLRMNPSKTEYLELDLQTPGLIAIIEHFTLQPFTLQPLCK